MADHVPAQAEFVGGLALAPFIVALLTAVLMIYVGTSAGPAIDVQETPPMTTNQAAEPVPGA